MVGLGLQNGEVLGNALAGGFMGCADRGGALDVCTGLAGRAGCGADDGGGAGICGAGSDRGGAHGGASDHALFVGRFNFGLNEHQTRDDGGGWGKDHEHRAHAKEPAWRRDH
jgi:hypothetical protein